MKSISWKMVVILGMLSAGWGNSNAAPPVIINITPAAAQVEQYGKYEVQFDLNTIFSNPFDPAVVDVKGIFTAPDNSVSTTLGFWYQAFSSAGGVNALETYTSAGTPRWMLRFAPTQSGSYSCQLQVTAVTGTSVSTSLHFTVTSSAQAGFIRLHPNNKKYYSFDRGGLYYPSGHDWAGSSPGTRPSYDGVTAAHYYHPRLAANKVNWFRYWMADAYHNALEWTGSGYSGVGKYALDRAWRVDKVIDSAEANNLKVQYTMIDFRHVSDWADIYWPQSPYNAINGGPVPADRPQDFFSNTTARELFKRQLRYVVARWGYSTDIFAWELFNEVEYSCDSLQNVFTNSTIKNNVIDWHREMAEYLKAIDPNQHLVTTSSDDPWYPNVGYLSYSLFSNLWLIPQIDIIQTHIYTFNIENDIVQQSRYFHQAYQKAHMVAEFGIQNLTEYNNTTTGTMVAHGFDPTTYVGTSTQREHLTAGTHLHNALWTALLNESMAGIWWWDYYMESDSTLHRNEPQFPLYYHYIPLNTFLQVSMNPVKYPYEDWANYHLSTASLSMSSTLKAYGLSSPDRGYLWFRDALNDYTVSVLPGDLANRTISNATVTIYGMDTNTRYALQYFDTYNQGGPLGSIQYLFSSSSGTLSIPIIPFQRDCALKWMKPAVLTAVQDEYWQMME